MAEVHVESVSSSGGGGGHPTQSSSPAFSAILSPSGQSLLGQTSSPNGGGGGASGKNNSVKLKCYHKHDIRAISISEGISFRSLMQRLAQDYGFEVSLKYEDRDGDYIILSCQNDLNELFAGVLEFKLRVVKVLVDEKGQEKSGSQRVLLSPTPTSSAATLNPLPPTNSTGGPENSSKSSTFLQGGNEATGVGDVKLSSSAGAASHQQQQSNTSSHQSHQIFHVVDDEKLAGALQSENTLTSAKQPLSLRPIPSKSEPDTSALGSVPPARQQVIAAERIHNPAFQSSDEPKIRWQRAELIGSGAFGRVYLGLNLDTGQLMAVKHLDISEVSGKELKALENEVQTLKFLQHENIVQYLGYEFCHEDNKGMVEGGKSSTDSDRGDDKKDNNDAMSSTSSGMLSHHPASAQNRRAASRVQGNFR